MEIKINIDMGKIDYESINKKILEKIDDDFIESVVSEYYLNESDLRELVEKKVLSAINHYTSNGYGYFSHSPSDYAKRVAKEILEKRLNEEIDTIFEAIGKETLNKLIVDAIPTGIIHTIVQNINSNIRDAIDFRNITVENNIRNEIVERLGQKGILI